MSQQTPEASQTGFAGTPRVAFAPHPALGLLIRLKLRGALRRRRRSLGKPSGVVFALLGFILFCLWLYAVLNRGQRGLPMPEPGLLRQAMQLMLAFFSLIILAGSLNTRGLYFPAGECDRLFSAPLAARDLIRYRVLTDSGRALLSATVFALISRRNFEHPLCGALAIFLALLTMSLVRQGGALLFANPSGRLAHLFKGRRLPGLPLLAAAGVFFTIKALRDGARGEANPLVGALSHPLAEALLLPFRPWAELATATDAGAFGLWLVICLAITTLLYKFVTGSNVEFREASLETSKFIAGRMRRLGKGGGRFDLAGPKRGKRGPGIPHVFGRGPSGAVAHLQLSSILRRPLSTYFLALFVIGAVTFGAATVFSGASRQETLGGSLMIVIIGTIYLCGGMRFDFRSNLERIGDMKTWPLGSARLFLATILPQACLIWLFITMGVVVRAVAAGGGGLELLWVMSGAPFLVLTWMGLDNALFLVFPVRFTPGQDGAMHHIGRTLALLFLRLGAFVVLAGVAGGVAFAGYWLTADLLGGGATLAMTVAWLGALVSLGLLLVPLMLAGGLLLRRFDPSRSVAS
ncbi:MAG: hypothetical protein QF724_00170 [Planctomycetota bacterium]|jgi:hypothetical protein|nr:hypothetical protein [Planctomycetota bacterium]